MRLRNVLTRARSGPGPVVAVLAVLFAGMTICAGTTLAAAHPASNAAAVTAGPAPHILDFARGLRGARLKLPKGPSRVAVAANVDGCDHDYGRVSQCVPWTIPAPAADRCQWLAAHGFGPLKVTGRDRLDLDTNRDGVACDHPDAGA